ncbi:mannose-6-phosphate isomerase, class I [Plantibacter sp. Mn2098]|uniref:mannose-6-phosphate isomerase, class I n=1 Tax=Plantibacter sp. Mn2098 TaxID=3395266 RepID=UPI003BD9CC0D
MFVPLTAVPRDYAWGSHTAIAEVLGSQPSGGPEAELWLGAHPGAPTRIVDAAALGGAQDLKAWIEQDPAAALGGLQGLPFLLKVLAADHPLSLQAHPDLARAAAGFADENERGIPLDAPFRNYKDALHKPELIVALRDGFQALCGFRELGATDALLSALAATAADEAGRAAIESLRARVAAPGGLSDVVGWLLGDAPADVIAAVVAAAAGPADAAPDRWVAERTLVATLAEEYPGDAGIVVATLLNLVTLRAGEALYLPAGNIHAYLRGIGIELMAASDNVLRGGLTPKHVDVPELLSVLEFEPRPVPWLPSVNVGAGLDLFVPDVRDFELLRAEVTTETTISGAEFELPGPGIVIVTSGEVTIAGATSSTTLARGEYAYVTPDEATLRFSGAGTLFLATTQP